jgi:GTP-binding protein
VIDTGGILFDDSEDIFADRITEQALISLREATVAVIVCDGLQGLQPLDTILADWLRKNCKIPLYVAVNKCESDRRGIAQAQEFWALGLGNPFPISSIHGVGINDLLDEITSKHMIKVQYIIPENATNVAIIGRPNVGKSSLFNKLYGANRTIVSNIAGTTRDIVDELIERGNHTYRIIDTAGIRRKSKVGYGAEFFMINRAFHAIKRSEVVVKCYLIQ